MHALIDPLISPRDIAAWQHRAILLAFLVQGRPRLALKYSRVRRPPQKDVLDVKLHVSEAGSDGRRQKS